MRLFVHEVRTEQLLFWRNREAAFFTFFLPIIFFLVFGSIYGNSTITKEHIRAAPFLEAGMIGYGVASTAFAKPKSSTFPVPSGRTLLFAGLRSRWMIPCSCAASSAAAICSAISRASLIGLAPCAVRPPSPRPPTNPRPSATAPPPGPAHPRPATRPRPSSSSRT